MNVEKERERLFTQMKDVLDVSHRKFSKNNGRGNTDIKRMKWARVFIQGFSAYGKLLETAQLDDLVHEIEEIKQHIGMKGNVEGKSSARSRIH